MSDPNRPLCTPPTAISSVTQVFDGIGSPDANLGPADDSNTVGLKAGGATTKPIVADRRGKKTT